MKTKPITPYQRLAEKYDLLLSRVNFPRTRRMWAYPKERLADGWALVDLSERVRAADQLNWNVCLRWDDALGLVVEYRERVNL